MFGVTVLPVGITIGFFSTPLPFLLAQAGVPVDRIASTVSILSLPWIFCYLWAPLIDVKYRRRTWLIVSAIVAAACLCLALPLIGRVSLLEITVLSLGAGIASSLVLATCGGLLVTTLPPAAQAPAAAWYEGGKLGGSALGGGLMLWMAQHTSIALTVAGTAAIIVVPALLALAINEPSPSDSRTKRTMGEIIGEVRTLLRSPARRWGILLLASPVGTGAATALLPAIASSYRVGGDGVVWINGVAGGLVLALGALSGALLPANWDRKLSYVGAGLVNALTALILLTAPRPEIYLLGTILYMATTGCCWARYAALVAETVGPVHAGAGTRFSLVSAAGTLPLAYMVWLDGVGFHRFGNRGLLWTDAAGNVLMFAVVSMIFLFAGIHKSSEAAHG